MSSTSSSTTLVPPSPPLHLPSNTKQINAMKSECCQIFATYYYIPGVCAGVPGQMLEYCVSMECAEQV